MHRLNIFHFDVKPDNIVYSYQQKRWVFLDFNLSEIREVQPGFNTRMGFRGSINYCYNEMIQLFNERHKVGYIDPFYNDAYSLKTSLGVILPLMSL
jgi:serine/threonine protein kinase